MVDALSTFTLNGNQETTKESILKKEIVSEITDTKELPEGIFFINFRPIDQDQRKYPSLLAKYKEFMYQKYSFCGGSNINLNFITC